MKNKTNMKENDNYLDYVPFHNEEHKWEADEEGNITIFVENKGAFNEIAQKIFGKPKVSQIHLDEMGNFVWPLIDGKRSVYEIGEFVKEEFGDKSEPLYQRLVQYIGTLESYEFIKMEKK